METTRVELSNISFYMGMLQLKFAKQSQSFYFLACLIKFLADQPCLRLVAGWSVDLAMGRAK